MATSSSNKMPLLVDRPLHSFATIGATACLTSATDFNTPSSAGCVLLVDCSANDGAVVDSLSVLVNVANTATKNVLIFLSTALTSSSITSANSVYVAQVAIPGSSTAGQRVNIPLPPLTIPVPNLGADSSITETDKKNTGLYVPSSALLYTGVHQALAGTEKVHVFAQGGFF